MYEINEQLFEEMEKKSWTYLVMCLQKYSEHNRHGYWTDGEEILCKTAEAAEHLADFLEDIGFDCVHTGYYDPEEDRRNNEIDDHTGWYYVNID